MMRVKNLRAEVIYWLQTLLVLFLHPERRGWDYSYLVRHFYCDIIVLYTGPQAYSADRLQRHIPCAAIKMIIAR